ncbi:MAG: hypothetical protein JWN14_549 [Chthonomonadales bacterium]|nr:hypothetical protein [Chthonomonadales bacterium]
MSSHLKTGERTVRWLTDQWRKRSVLSRVTLSGVFLLFIARRILWLFTTPANRADIPRALTVIEVFLAASWIELAFIAVLLMSLAGEVWQHRKQNRLKMMEANS